MLGAQHHEVEAIKIHFIVVVLYQRTDMSIKSKTQHHEVEALLDSWSSLSFSQSSNKGV